MKEVEIYAQDLLIEKIAEKVENEYCELRIGQNFVKEVFEFEDRDAVVEMIVYVDVNEIKEWMEVRIESAAGRFFFDDESISMNTDIIEKIEKIKN